MSIYMDKAVQVDPEELAQMAPFTRLIPISSGTLHTLHNEGSPESLAEGIKREDAVHYLSYVHLYSKRCSSHCFGLCTELYPAAVYLLYVILQGMLCMSKLIVAFTSTEEIKDSMGGRMRPKG